MEDLRPCPFCGGEAAIYEPLATSLWFVCCSNGDMCSTCGPDRGTRSEAIEAWNSRANDDQQVCLNCQHYKKLNMGRERYCHVWSRKSPMVFDSFSCGWWKRKTDTDGA